MALGATVVQERFENPREILGDRLREGSLYRLLADTGDRLFGDDYFADLYKRSPLGRPTVPARVLATVTLLQSFEGLSDREACDRLEVDLRWQAAAGVSTGAEAFHPTVLVGLRNRLRASDRPRRLFEDTKVVARQAGLSREGPVSWTRRRSMTQWRPKTPSPSCGRPSASCSWFSTTQRRPWHRGCG
ncbi:MAG: transposase, partial [Acidimicrobiales bacterium]